MFCHIYIGKPKENGSLTELAGMVERCFDVTDLYVGEGRGKLEANVRFLTRFPHVTDLLETLLIGNRTNGDYRFRFIAFLKWYLFGGSKHNQDEFIELFTAEADFIGYYSLEFQPTSPSLFDPPAEFGS
jgi:hypothetical protein